MCQHCLRKLKTWDEDIRRDMGRTFSLLQTKDCLSYMKTMDVPCEGVNLDTSHNLFLLKEVLTLMWIQYVLA